MIAEKFVDLYARNSGLRDKLIAERDVVLTYALRALVTDGVMGPISIFTEPDPPELCERVQAFRERETREVRAIERLHLGGRAGLANHAVHVSGGLGSNGPHCKGDAQQGAGRIGWRTLFSGPSSRPLPGRGRLRAEQADQLDLRANAELEEGPLQGL